MDKPVSLRSSPRAGDRTGYARWDPESMVLEIGCSPSTPSAEPTMAARLDDRFGVPRGEQTIALGELEWTQSPGYGFVRAEIRTNLTSALLSFDPPREPISAADVWLEVPIDENGRASIASDVRVARAPDGAVVISVGAEHPVTWLAVGSGVFVGLAPGGVIAALAARPVQMSRGEWDDR